MKGKTLQESRSRPVVLENVPEDLIHFIWASEDQSFFEHNGFDVPRIRTAIAEAKDGEARGVHYYQPVCSLLVSLAGAILPPESPGSVLYDLDGAFHEQAAYFGTLSQSY